MSLEDEDQQLSPVQPVETDRELQKNSKILYSRDFLLAFRDLDVCQKFPAGFDESLLSEFEDSSQDRQRNYVGLSVQSFRRSEYGLSPPNRGDSNNHSRGIHGRWETRASGRSDRDSDSQSDWDSDSGRRYGNQSRQSYQVPEHDGLLGSGSFPRPPGYAARSASRFQANDHHQLIRNNEPYHPPRPYKAVPHSRRDTDSINDETFGTSESPGEDRAEEERKRRASFELMRKEQQRAFQEKQKLNPDKHKGDFDITTLQEDSKDEKKILNINSESEEPLILPASNHDYEKSSFYSQTSTSRPLVPPGFTTTVLEKNFGTKPIVHPHSVKVVNPELGDSLLLTKSNRVLNGTSDKEKKPTEQMDMDSQQLGATSIHVSFDKQGEKILNLSSALDISNKTVGMDSQSGISEALEASEVSEVVELDAEKIVGNKIVVESNQDHSNSILDKLFGSALTITDGGSSRFTEDNKEDGLLGPNTVQSSKFSHWFLEDEKKPVNELSFGQSNDLFSLIVGGEKGKSQVPNAKGTECIPPKLLLQNSELADRHTVSDIPVIAENSEQFYNNKTEGAPPPAVLTCEDLEQSILSEISENGLTLQLSVPGQSVFDVKAEQPKTNIDDRASQHLLSLLQKGMGPNDITPSPNLEISLSDKERNIEAASIVTGPDRSREAEIESGPNPSKTLTLETLFGTAFMKELQSVGAPVSVQRGSAGTAGIDVSEPHGLPIPVIDDGNVPSLAGEIGYNMSNHESSVLVSNQHPQIKIDKIKEPWLSFDDSRTAMDSSQLQSEIRSKLGGFGGPADIRLPEEDSLIAISDPVIVQNFMPARNPANPNFLPSPNTSADIAEKLAALNSVFKDERTNVGRQEGPFHRGPFDMREPDVPYQDLHVQPSSPQLRPSQFNHAGPLFPPLDAHPAHLNSQMKFRAQEGIFHHEPSPNHQLPANMLRHPFHHPSTGLTGFDPPAHHPMLQQMQIPGNFPPPHVLRGFPRGAPMPPHPSIQVTGFMQELNPLQGHPFGQRPPNFGGLGMPPPDPNGGGGESNHPETLQRLMEMEFRSKSKQFQPFAGAGQSQGMYGNELDMGFRYR